MIEATIVAILAAFVLFSSICRLSGMHIFQHKPLWLGVYLGFAWFSGAELMDALRFACFHIGSIRLSVIPALFAASLWLWGSRLTRHSGPPTYIERTVVSRV